MQKNIKMKKVDINKLSENMNPFNKAQLYRLQKWQDTVKQNSKNTNVDYAVSKITLFSNKLKLDKSVQDRIVDVYTDSVEQGVLTGRSIELLVASSIYVGLRLEHIPRTTIEISEVCKIGDKELLRTARVICKETGVRLPVLTPNDFVPYFCSKLHVSDTVKDKCFELLEDCEMVGLLNGRSPSAMAGVCLYLASNLCDERRTQRDVAEVAGVTEVTIRTRLRELRKVLELE